MLQVRREKLSAFDLVEAFHLSHAVSTLYSLGVLETLRRPLTPEATAKLHGLDSRLIGGLLEYAAARTALVCKVGKRFAATEFYSSESQFLLELYTGAYRDNSVCLDTVLRRPGLAPTAVNRKRHTQAIKIGRSFPVKDVPELIRQLQFNYILDIGCGSGALLVALAKQNPHFVGWGLEMNSSMCRLARAGIKSKGIKGIRIVRGDSRNPLRALPADVRSRVQTVTACQVANEMFGAGCSGAVAWLRGLRSTFPGRPLLIADYYGRLGSKASCDQRHTILHDYVQLISGQGVPPSNIKQWKAIYAEAGCRFAHAIEDTGTTRFIHVVVLGSE